MTTQNTTFNERINYTIDNGKYCGHSVNLPIVVQANTMDELKKKIRTMVKIYIQVLQETLNNDNFEYIEGNWNGNEITK